MPHPGCSRILVWQTGIGRGGTSKSKGQGDTKQSLLYSMGSYLSIYNDTGDTVMIKTGEDEEAKRIFGIATGIVAGVAATIAGAGWAVGALSGGLVTITASAAVSGLAAACSATTTALKLAESIKGHFRSKGYTVLEPGHSYKSGKMTLSMWRQCHVVRCRRAGNKVSLDHCIMRPIFSGATDGSTNVHRIGYWVEKHGYSELKTFLVKLPEKFTNSAIDENRNDVLCGGQFLRSGNNAKIRSQNGQYVLVQQSDSHLVLYKGKRPIWSNNAWGKCVHRTIMQKDGDLVSYTQDGTAVWASNTHRNPGAYLIVQNDGNLVIYKAGRAIWASGTNGC